MTAPRAINWWRWTLALVLGATLLRILTLALTPLELAGDEAQYWDWSRRLDLSYYSKGPAIAWTIAASTRPLGDTEFAVRLPAALAGAVLALAAAALARRMSGSPRAGFLAACLILLLPAYQVIALVMTIDGPYVASWAVASLMGWIAADRLRSARPWLTPALTCAAALGIGFLYKYTILLLAPGLLAWAWLSAPPPRRRTLVPGLLACVAVFLAVISPVIIWNAREGWPTLAHLLGHLGMRGGDLSQKAAEPWRYNPLWTLEYLGAQIGMVGPMAVIMLLSLRSSRSAPAATPTPAPSPRLFIALTALPIFAFYFITSFITDVEGNWPIAGSVTLVAGAAGWLAHRLPESPPSRLPRALWHASIIYGAVAGIAILLLPLVARLPVIGRAIPLHRLSGHRAVALDAARLAADLQRETGLAPVIAADRYDRAALLAFYMPDRPAVASAASLMGDRRSSYDFFPDTDLRSAAFLHKPFIMVGGGEKKWRRALVFDAWRDADPAGSPQRAVPMRIGFGYRGPATFTHDDTDHPPTAAP